MIWLFLIIAAFWTIGIKHLMLESKVGKLVSRIEELEKTVERSKI